MMKTIHFMLIATLPLLVPHAWAQNRSVHTHSATGTPIRVLLLDGESAGVYHNWKATTPVLRRELEETGLFQVTVITAPASGGDFSAFDPKFKNYQVIVSNLDAPDWPENLRAQFEEYVRAGGGLVVIHAADNSFPDWPAYNQMIGIGGWRNRDEHAGPYWYVKDGKLVSDNTPGKAGAHGARLPFQVVAQVPDHPILKGLASGMDACRGRALRYLARPWPEYDRSSHRIFRPAEQGLRQRRTDGNGPHLRKRPNLPHADGPRRCCAELHRVHDNLSAWYRMGRDRKSIPESSRSLSGC